VEPRAVVRGLEARSPSRSSDGWRAGEQLRVARRRGDAFQGSRLAVVAANAQRPTRSAIAAGTSPRRSMVQ